MTRQSRVRLGPYPGYDAKAAWMREGATMVRYRRNRTPDGTYFFTVTLRNRRSDLLVRRIAALRESWRSAKSRTAHDLIAVVVLPDHLHALIRMRDGAGDYSRLWQDIKKGFTRGTTPPAAASPWQARFWEHAIRDEVDLRRHVDYIHINPMKHGLVQHVVDWPHSSFHRYVGDGALPADWAGSCQVQGRFGE